MAQQGGKPAALGGPTAAPPALLQPCELMPVPLPPPPPLPPVAGQQQPALMQQQHGDVSNAAVSGPPMRMGSLQMAASPTELKVRRGWLGMPVTGCRP